ncbi:MAG: hypothetical protein COA57_11585 [Flavobacteriales bacterium]|nr:MAG: hypothetical protein COA57_11585 [Flavobacteriales bacterium]
MKRYFFLFTFYFLLSSLPPVGGAGGGLYSQSLRDVFYSSEAEIWWLGIDFSNAKMIGDFSQFDGSGKVTPVQMRDEYFQSWNNLIMRENEKYNLKRAFRKRYMPFDLEMIEKRNANCNVDDMYIKKTYVMERGKLDEIVSQYDFGDKQGTGLIFILESFDKYNKVGFLYVTFVDMSSKKILMAERVSGEPMGFGLRNYWAGSIYHAILDIQDEKFRQWKAKYASN